uniref:Carboxymethylenebutenolidase homolog n=1 Tax=Gopherus evgoodei TaxID=1825980 RepID=A0A8C4VUW6_9SAUR
MTSDAQPFLYDIGKRTDYVGLGHEEQVEHIKAYVCKPSSVTDKAVIVIHDIYGWQFPDIRYITDLVAAEGYVAICPDFFLGKKPWTSADHWAEFRDWLKDRACSAKKIGVIGFSWGGMAVHHLMLKNPELKTGVSLYGIIRDSDDRYNLLNPTFFIFGEKDHTISYDQVSIILLEKKLKQYCQVEYRIKVYPGQIHGFAELKPDDMKPRDKPYIEEARKDMMNWLKTYV